MVEPNGSVQGTKSPRVKLLSIELLNPTSIFKFTRTACCLPHSCRKLFLKDESFHNSNHFHLTCLLCRFGNSYRHEQVSFLPSLTHSHIDKMFWGRCRMLGPGLGPGREGRTVDACSLRSGKHRVVNQQTVTQDLQPRELMYGDPYVDCGCLVTCWLAGAWLYTLVTFLNYGFLQGE